jgi:two-component system osmolarity sensor histidine kinase EnvZ
MGLGLAISREIVTRHQGQLQLHNHPQGGLEAAVSIPLAAGAFT